MVNLAGESCPATGMHVQFRFQFRAVRHLRCTHCAQSDDRTWTAGIMERSDEQILPSLYSRVGAAFDATPSQLGWSTLARAVVQAVASPIGGIAGFKLNRVWVISFGCLLWGIMTVGLNCARNKLAMGICYVASVSTLWRIVSARMQHTDSFCIVMQACFAGTHSVATGAMFWGVNGIGLSLVSLQRHTAENVLARVVTLCHAVKPVLS
jgi:hypothetical protein